MFVLRPGTGDWHCTPFLADIGTLFATFSPVDFGTSNSHCPPTARHTPSGGDYRVERTPTTGYWGASAVRTSDEMAYRPATRLTTWVRALGATRKCNALSEGGPVSVSPRSSKERCATESGMHCTAAGGLGLAIGPQRRPRVYNGFGLI